MVVNAPRKSFRKQISTEELPLVSFDQLSQKTPSPTETKLIKVILMLLVFVLTLSLLPHG